MNKERTHGKHRKVRNARRQGEVLDALRACGGFGTIAQLALESLLVPTHRVDLIPGTGGDHDVGYTRCVNRVRRARARVATALGQMRASGLVQREQRTVDKDMGPVDGWVEVKQDKRSKKR